MRQHHAKSSKRPAAIAVLFAISLVPALIFVAFVINLGHIYVARQEMQQAADSAALAGASQLLVAGLPYNGGSDDTLAAANITKAIAEAQKFCVANTARGTNLSLLSADCVVGYINPSNPSSTLVPWAKGQPYPNAVEVAVRRDGTVNTPVPLFLGAMVGMSNWNARVSSTACTNAHTETVTGFDSTTGNAKLLPLAVDYNLWQTFLQSGKSADGLVHDGYKATAPSTTTPAPKNVTPGGDGVPEFTDVYPNATSPGNFGLVSIGTPSNASPSYSTWIMEGPSPADMAYFGPNGIQASPTSPLTMDGGPGLKSTLISDFANIVGQPRSVILYTSYTGPGSNATYTVVGFAGCTIVDASGSGTNIQLTIQPMIVTDPTGTGGSTTTTQYIYRTSPLSLIR
jgi:Flp pilus assembly protein TadG